MMKKIFYTFLLISPLLFIASCGEDVVHGCIDFQACNFNPEATNDNGSCNYPVLGYDCYGDSAEFYVGQKFNTGIVFYVDETGQHGLVAAMEDLPNFYQWGCWAQNVDGADGTYIGTGYQNTMDIVNQGCEPGANEGIIAAQAALDAEINGYSDWYLPSKDELVEMYNTIANGGLDGNIGGFENNTYWSSSERDNTGWSMDAWYVAFINGSTSYYGKSVANRVRPIRSF